MCRKEGRVEGKRGGWRYVKVGWRGRRTEGKERKDRVEGKEG